MEGHRASGNTARGLHQLSLEKVEYNEFFVDISSGKSNMEEQRRHRESFCVTMRQEDIRKCKMAKKNNDAG